MRSESPRVYDALLPTRFAGADPTAGQPLPHAVMSVSGGLGWQCQGLVAFGVLAAVSNPGTSSTSWTDYLSVGNAKVDMRRIQVASETLTTRSIFLRSTRSAVN